MMLLCIHPHQGPPSQDLVREDFPLPALAPLLLAMRRAVVRGRGFQIIKGEWPWVCG